ncbi:hypothetical protein DITRI_Ditri10aG0077700 [Diplodiscus trichospermus]
MEMEYEGLTKYCKCQRKGYRMKAPKWTSETDENPRCRFYGCSNYQVKICGFFEWHNEALTDRAKELLNDMKMERKILLAENIRWKEISGGMVTGCDFENEIAQLWSELSRLKKAQEAECQKARKKMVTTYVVVLVSWLIILVRFMV